MVQLAAQPNSLIDHEDENLASALTLVCRAAGNDWNVAHCSILIAVWEDIASASRDTVPCDLRTERGMVVTVIRSYLVRYLPRDSSLHPLMSRFIGRGPLSSSKKTTTARQGH